MLVIGTGGMAGDLLFSLSMDYPDGEIAFYNDIGEGIPEYISKDFQLVRTEEEAAYYFRTTDKRFLIAVGDNLTRHYLSVKFEKLGGDNRTYISKEARVGRYNNIHPKGALILADAHITNDIVVDEGVVFYLRAGVGHYTHLHPYSLVSGGCNTSSAHVGAYTTVGINVGIRPGTRIGKHAFIGLGSTITKDVDDYAVMFGNPARKIRDCRAAVGGFLEKHPGFNPY